VNCPVTWSKFASDGLLEVRTTESPSESDALTLNARSAPVFMLIDRGTLRVGGEFESTGVNATRSVSLELTVCWGMLLSCVMRVTL
jgi:hypothetical protein